MELVFLGTGAGCGVPTFYCGCEVCQEAAGEPRYQRTRSAIALTGKENILFDAPPELASQLHRERIDAIDQLTYLSMHYSTPVTSRKIEEIIEPYKGKVLLAHDGLRLQI